MAFVSVILFLILALVRIRTIFKIALLAPIPAITRRTRINKMVGVFLENDIEVDFFGWKRDHSELTDVPYDSKRVTENLILTGGGYASWKTRVMYPVWMTIVFFTVLRLGRKKTIFCLGWETAFPAKLASMFTRSTIIFDDADRFSLIFSLPGLLKRILQSLERWTSRTVALHIIPGWSRYDWKHDRMMVLRNAPTTTDFLEAAKLAPEKPSKDLVVYANGWIGQTRGAPIFLAALNKIAEKKLNLSLLIAGRLDCPDGIALSKHPLVTYYGEVSQKKALSLYPISDIVLTFYDPKVPINRKAESNKWGDCVFFKKPFIVNSEVETAQNFTEKRAAFSTKYDDISQLVNLLESLLLDKALLYEAEKLILKFKDDYPVFENGMLRVIEVVKLQGSQEK